MMKVSPGFSPLHISSSFGILSGSPLHAALAGHELLKNFDHPANEVAHLDFTLHFGVFLDGEDFGFNFVEKVLHVIGILVGLAD